MERGRSNPSSFEHLKGDSEKNRAAMEVDLQRQHHQKQINSGLMRYQSAPSSYFSNFTDRGFCDEFLNRPSSPETERIFARFLSSSGGGGQNSPVRETVTELNQQTQIMASMNNEAGVIQQRQSSYSSASQNFYQSQPQQPLPNQNSSSGVDYRVASSMGMDRLPQMKMGSGNNSNLIRHSSSPAGLFSHIDVENGYAVMRGMGDFGAGNSTNREASFSPANRLRNQINFSSGPTSSSRVMSPIAENKNMMADNPDSGGFGEGHSNNYITGFPMGSWDDSSMMPENITAVKRLTDEDRTLSDLDPSETQNREAGNRPPLLAHHLSLPKTSSEMTAIEKFLQFQDSVPCKIRAKRGCATHPRSIAERVRRTRISERMRKLQDLVPNMDKQTNTADMLDLAVDYIKELQKQVKTLSENRTKCTCSNKQQQQQQ